MRLLLPNDCTWQWRFVCCPLRRRSTEHNILGTHPFFDVLALHLRLSCVGSDMRGIVLHLQVLGWRNVGACAPCNSRMPQVAPASTATGPWLARAAEPHATKTHARGPQSHTQHGRRIQMTSTVFVLVLHLSFSDPGSWFMSCLVSLVHLLNIQRARVISETTQRCTAYVSMTNGHQTIDIYIYISSNHY